ncbi:sensor histidine kinase [Massilia sp. DWR3-1-1]|uniref:sensor histidine kinase n=1 Tax=Massilia sp. DWR3-1-1 TaxID=2804559 RepID=UPI003CF651BC
MRAPPSPPADAPAQQPGEPAPDAAAGGSAGDVRELLGHMTDSWDMQRRALARQMHDSLGSSMTALTMHLALLTQQMPKEKALLDRSAQMKTLLMTIINTNRDMQLALWNDSLEFLGVRPAITEVLERFRERQRLVARLSLPDEEVSYPRQQAAALMRALEEGLSNIVAHAGATEVDVILDDDGDQVMLTVRDNGIGIGAAAFSGEHHGLRSLRERALYLGGSLVVGPAPQGASGTCLTFILPRQDAGIA